MNWFACYLTISCCNKFSIFFVVIREPGQNVHCRKLGGPCNPQLNFPVDRALTELLWLSYLNIACCIIEMAVVQVGEKSIL